MAKLCILGGSVVLSLALLACPLGLTSSGDDLDAGDGSGSDRGSTRHDSGGGNLDATVAPDVVAEEGGYVVSSGNGQPGSEQTGSRPQGDSNSPVYIDPFSGNTTFIPGGTNLFSGGIQGGLAQALVVYFDQLSGYYQVPSGGTAFNFHVTLGQNVRAANLTLVVIPVLAVTESQPMGGYGRPLRVPCTVQQVGTGELQVSLSWSTATDVDLHLVEPGGQDIYWDDMTSASGGELDLDSNPGCRMDNVNNENITYANGTPASGHYIVRVDYWSACAESGTTDFVVTVNIRGTPSVYQGSFVVGDADQGDANSGITIAEFDF
ncbi:MAG: hypothetical protein ABIJ09_16805 [Pseudomonadota bacterium]